MNLKKIADDLAQVWGFPNFAAVPTFGQERIRIEINAAVQQMQASGEDFFGREDVTIDLAAGTGSYELDLDIQSILDPVLLQDGTLLRKLTTYGQVIQYGAIFRESSANAVSDGKPEAYFIDSKKSGDEEDSVRSILQLLPAPSAGNITDKVVLPVIMEIEPVLLGQLSAGTATLAVPNKHIDSIFLPLARYNLTTCFLFYKNDTREKYQSDYQRALRMLGQADPRQYPKPADSNSAALDVTPPTQQQGSQ